VETIIETVRKHLMELVEQPHPVMSNMPLCPFAKRARLHNRIRFEVLEFNGKEEVLRLAETMTKDHDVMFVIHPGKLGFKQ
jgi:hypothetical protein